MEDRSLRVRVTVGAVRGGVPCWAVGARMRAWPARHQGRATTYGQIATAIRKVIPAAAIELREA